MAGHMYDKAHAQQQQQQRRFTQTSHRTKVPLPTPITKKLKSYPKRISHNINHALVQYQSNPSTIYYIYKPTIKTKNKSS